MEKVNDFRETIDELRLCDNTKEWYKNNQNLSSYLKLKEKVYTYSLNKIFDEALINFDLAVNPFMNKNFSIDEVFESGGLKITSDIDNNGIKIQSDFDCLSINLKRKKNEICSYEISYFNKDNTFINVSHQFDEEREMLVAKVRTVLNQTEYIYDLTSDSINMQNKNKKIKEALSEYDKIMFKKSVLHILLNATKKANIIKDRIEYKRSLKKI